MIYKTMGVIVDGKVERRRVDCVTHESPGLGLHSGPRIVEHPLHEENEMVCQTISGETIIIRI